MNPNNECKCAGCGKCTNSEATTGEQCVKIRDCECHTPNPTEEKVVHESFYSVKPWKANPTEECTCDNQKDSFMKSMCAKHSIVLNHIVNPTTVSKDWREEFDKKFSSDSFCSCIEGDMYGIWNDGKKELMDFIAQVEQKAYNKGREDAVDAIRQTKNRT